MIEIDYSFRTKLEELSDEEAIELLKASLINGREGFMCHRLSIIIALLYVLLY
ncbi:Mobile element protein [Methanosarcina siciliae C2J]|uniref:Mobile element protein n=1 Tax=Methanosarcina siciliae C2J TaxID=1434118 RepID=A0A0E3PTH3_9EURY|nr:Mobile element protein [Methanosarcina siciliae C2J]